MSDERRSRMAIFILLVIGITNGMVIDIIAGLQGRELAFYVWLPVSTCLVTAVIARAAFSRMRGSTVVVLTMCDAFGSAAMLLASALLPRGAIPLPVKLAWLGHTIGWFIGVITRTCTDRNRSYHSRWIQITPGRPNTLDLFETPRPIPFDDAFHFDPQARHTYMPYWHTIGAYLLSRIHELSTMDVSGLDPADREACDRAREKDRDCPECHCNMSFTGFAIRNYNAMTLLQLAKIWLDDRVVLRCCSCFDSRPADDPPVSSQPHLTNAAGNPVQSGPAYPYDIQIENVTAPPVAIDQQGGVRYLHEYYHHEEQPVPCTACPRCFSMRRSNGCCVDCGYKFDEAKAQ